MKKFMILPVAALLFLACKPGTESNAEAQSTKEKKEAKTGGKKDPVCGMDYDTTWTEFAVNNTDTAWFCSPHCKESYTANPAKYNKKEEQKEDKKG